jgi:L-alanine-DL-glutamate epimerase-like enolase superfamily enzyme
VREAPVKITGFSVEPLTLIPNVPLSVAYGDYPEFEYLLLKLFTDTGAVGLGEAAPDPYVTGETPGILTRQLEQILPKLTGTDPLNREKIFLLYRELLPQFPAAAAAIDTAVWDLAGKALGRPVSALLGGTVREGMELYPVVPLDTPEQMAETAVRFSAMGVRSLKVKIGTGIPEDTRRIALIAEKTEHAVRLRVDVNQGWGTPEVAARAVDTLKDFPIDWIEQPVAAEDIPGMAAVKESSPFPIAADESCKSPGDALRIITEDAADIINIKLMKCGGLRQALGILALAESGKKKVLIGSMGESSIASSAGLQLALSRESVIGCECIGPLFLTGDPAEGFPADTARGLLLPNTKPGLGVDLV